jgi:hypothetical protein
MPLVFAPHGGGPWPFVDIGMSRTEVDDLAGYLRSIRALPTTPPKALLVISAHWEERVPTVMTNPRPSMFYDYYGFPPAAYEITWPAPGDPALAARVQSLLGTAGFATAADPNRGFRSWRLRAVQAHLSGSGRSAIQLSLKQGLDPEEHLAMGPRARAAPRRGRLHPRQRNDVSQHARLPRSERDAGSRRSMRGCAKPPCARRSNAIGASLRGPPRQPREPRTRARSTCCPSWSWPARPERIAACSRTAARCSDELSAYHFG